MKMIKASIASAMFLTALVGNIAPAEAFKLQTTFRPVKGENDSTFNPFDSDFGNIGGATSNGAEVSYNLGDIRMNWEVSSGVTSGTKDDLLSLTIDVFGKAGELREGEPEEQELIRSVTVVENDNGTPATTELTVNGVSQRDRESITDSDIVFNFDCEAFASCFPPSNANNNNVSNGVRYLNTIEQLTLDTNNTGTLPNLAAFQIRDDGNGNTRLVFRGEDGNQQDREYLVSTVAVPEPTTMLGVLTAFGLGGFFKRKHDRKA